MCRMLVIAIYNEVSAYHTYDFIISKQLGTIRRIPVVKTMYCYFMLKQRNVILKLAKLTVLTSTIKVKNVQHLQYRVVKLCQGNSLYVFLYPLFLIIAEYLVHYIYIKLLQPRYCIVKNFYLIHVLKRYMSLFRLLCHCFFPEVLSFECKYVCACVYRTYVVRME